MQDQKARTGIASASAFSLSSSDFWVQFVALVIGAFTFIGVDLGGSSVEIAEKALAAFASENIGKIIAFFAVTGFGLILRIAKASKAADWTGLIGSSNFWTYIFTGIFALVGLKWSGAIGVGAALIPILVNLVTRFFKQAEIDAAA